jgi:hypothetical protein
MSVRADVDPFDSRLGQVLAARNMAAATLSRSCNVTAQIVDPLPLRNAPRAPAFSAAAMTRGRNGTSFCRYG